MRTETDESVSTAYNGRATIIQADLELAVDCEIYERRRAIRIDHELLDAGTSWDGVWRSLEPTFRLRDAPATIRLDDGREGTIDIPRVTAPMRRGRFTGAGDLPR